MTSASSDGDWSTGPVRKLSRVPVGHIGHFGNRNIDHPPYGDFRKWGGPQYKPHCNVMPILGTVFRNLREIVVPQILGS